LDKRFKNCERNIQEHSNSIKSANLQILGIEEGAEVQVKGICNIFKKIIENFPNLKKELSIHVQQTSRRPSMTKIETFHGILYLRQLAQRTEKEKL
jgi:hypothetical protein